MKREPYNVIDWRAFRSRYPAEILKSRGDRTLKFGAELREKLGHKRILGLALHPHHDQTTIWWFEQGLLALLAATDWDTTWVTDAAYLFDDERIEGLRIVRDATALPDDPVDAIISLFPCDEANRQARDRGVPLIQFGIKNVLRTLQPLTEKPPPNTVLWHGFAGSKNFCSAMANLLNDRQLPPETAPGRHRGGPIVDDDTWPMRGVPFPINRYYFPLRPVSPPLYDVLVFGSNTRDIELIGEALAHSRAGRIVAIANEADVGRVIDVGRRNKLDLTVREPMNHVKLLGLLEQVRVVVNPIMPPAESHYSNSVPLALGRPLVISDLPSTQPFIGPGVRAAPLGDPGAWTVQIDALLAETAAGLPHRGALKQGRERHDLERFYTAAILDTLSL